MPALWPKYNSAPVPCWERGTLGPTSTVNHRAIYTLSSHLHPDILHSWLTPIEQRLNVLDKLSQRTCRTKRISVLLSLLSPPILVLSLHSGLFILRVSFHLLTCRSLLILRGTWRKSFRPLEPSVFRTSATGKQQVSCLDVHWAKMTLKIWEPGITGRAELKENMKRKEVASSGFNP